MRVILDKNGNYRSTVFGEVTLADGFSIVEIPDDTVGLHDGCAYVNGVMTGCLADREHLFEIVPDRSESILKDEIAKKRNELLLASDWTQLSDAPLPTKSAWTAYRQALRDITLQPDYPQTIVWPIKPI